MALQGTQRSSRLSQMQMRFQQKQQTEREQKKMDLLGSTVRPLGKLPNDSEDAKILTSSLGGGKVRQMFEERRSIGVDKSYPLKPIQSTTQPRLNSDPPLGRAAKPQAAIKPLNSVSRTGGVKYPAPQPPLTTASLDNYDFSRSIDRDPLNNTVVISSKTYASTNRVPSLKAAATNGNNVHSNNNNNNNIGIGGKLKPLTSGSGAKPAISTSTMSAVSPPKPEPRKVLSGSKSPPTKASEAISAKPVSSPKKAPISVPPPEGMVQCSICGRNFNEDRIAKHETICSKTAVKKRKVFDSTKHRVQGTEAESYVKKATKTKTKVVEKATAKKGDWRRKHEEFIQAIRAAKEMQAHLARGGKLSDLPPPPPSENPDYVQCPHCSRRFNQGAAERHIPKCATMLHNKPKPKPVARKR